MSRLKPRPSAADRWWAGGCRGYPRFAARYPDEPGPWGENGNRLHGLARDVLLARTQTTDKPEPTLVKDDADVVNPYVADVLRVHWGRPGSTLHVEQPTYWALNKDLEGTPDAALFDPARQHLIIWDLKTGWRLVEVVENPQLLSYAVMLTPPKWTVELRIVQPLPYHPDGSVRSWSLNWRELSIRSVDLDNALAQVREPDAPLKAGSHCIYCPALTGCPAARQSALSAVDRANAKPHDLPDEEIVQEFRVLQEAKKMLDLRVGALEEQIKDKLYRGERVPGARLRENKRGGRLNWDGDEEAIRQTLRLFLGRDVAVPKLPTPTQLKTAGVDPDLLKPFTKYKPGKMTLATDTDDAVDRAFRNPPDMEHIK